MIVTIWDTKKGGIGILSIDNFLKILKPSGDPVGAPGYGSLSVSPILCL